MQHNLLKQPVRIHQSLLLRHPAAKLWYLCRAADPQGRGRVELSSEDLALLGVSKPTLYRWLREGRVIGLFRIYRFYPDGSLYVSLGGLKKACRQSGMRSWGAVATVPLGEILEGFMRAAATALATQDLQERSRFAARNALNDLERRCFKIPATTEVLSPTSLKMSRGAVQGLVHVGPSKVFVGRSFIPFGVSQERICAELNASERSCGITPRTLRNHLKRLGVERRQLVQAKPEYQTISAAIKWGAVDDELVLDEFNGKSSAKRPGGHRLKIGRFFTYFGATWLYRCNLYDLEYELTSMKRSRREYKRSIRIEEQLPSEQTIAPTRSSTVENSAPEKSTASARPVGAALASHNKEEKNDNSYVEPVSEANGRDWHVKCLEQIAQLKVRNLEKKLQKKLGLVKSFG